MVRQDVGSCMKNRRFFKIQFPNGKSIAIVSKNGYAGLIELCPGIPGNAIIIEISFVELIGYTLSKEYDKRAIHKSN